MKSFIVLAILAVVAVARAAPQNPDAAAQIVRQENSNIGVGDYQASYQTSNGISSSEAGQLLQGGTDGAYLARQGTFSYTGPDGIQYTVEWIADTNGFQASGAHFPKSP